MAYGALGAAIAVVVYLVLSAGGAGGYTVRAAFHDVDGLRVGSTVKVDGVPAGIVSSLRVTRSDIAIATLTLDPAAAPVGAGASVEVRPTDLLGEHYAQLNVGDPKRPLRSGTLIPLTRTSVPVELDQILNTLNTDTRTRLRILINEAGIALAGRGADFNALLGALPPNLGQAQAMLEQISSENTTLQNLIDEGDRVTVAVNGKRDQLGTLIATADHALGAVAARQAQLGSTIQGAPGALSQLHATLSRLGAASQAIIPAANALEQTAAPLTSTLRELPPFAQASNATLVTARRVAPALVRLGRGARQPLVALRPTANSLRAIAASARPILSMLDARAIRDALWFVENWALALKGRDDLGHFVGADLEFDSSIFISALDSFTNDGGPLGAHGRHHRLKLNLAALLPSAAAPSKPNLGVTASGALNGVKQRLGGTVATVQHAVGAVGSAVGSLSGQPGGSGSGAGGSPSGPGSANPSSVQHLLQYLLSP